MFVIFEFFKGANSLDLAFLDYTDSIRKVKKIDRMGNQDAGLLLETALEHF